MIRGKYESGFEVHNYMATEQVAHKQSNEGKKNISKQMLRNRQLFLLFLRRQAIGSLTPALVFLKWHFYDLTVDCYQRSG